MIKFLAICRNTFIQAVRQPVFSILLLVTFMILVMGVPLTNWAMGIDYHITNQKMLESLGLGTLLMVGLLVAAFSASGALSREIEDKTVLTVMAKPVSRATFIFGKFGGVAAAVMLFYYLGSLVYLMTIRHKVMPAASDPYDWPVIVLGCSAVAISVVVALVGNYMFAWTFTSTVIFSAAICMSISMGVISFVGKGWQIVEFGYELHWQLVVALITMAMAVLIFVATAIAASTRLGQVTTLLVCFGILIVGSSHPYLFGYWSNHSVLAWAASWVCPNLTHFYPIDALAADKIIPMSFVSLAAVYCACFIAAMLALSVSLFERRPLEAQTTSSSLPNLVSLLAWAGRAGAIILFLTGLEGILSFLAVQWWPNFQPVILETMKNWFLQSDTADIFTFIPSACLIVVAVLAWILWGSFGRGAKWSYWVVMVIAILKLLHYPLVTMEIIKTSIRRGFNEPVLLTIQTALAAVVLIVLFLPKTRLHFRSASN